MEPLREELAAKACVPCRGGTPPMGQEEIARIRPGVPGWNVVADHHLARAFVFRDFATALAFVDRVGALAEEQGHHPDIHLSWGKVAIETWTHKIDGLTESDFVLAAKIDRLAAMAPGIES
ncbi:MAG: 4a-hydroxytetrahydrobiopterin dehydratase [Deltaproteobacteria bacterium]|nr:4a-hydroxytetrahydrobiopterin dehydratase [Deltaproteobacteria bacterium]